MKILGIQKDHNASACLFNDKELIYYNQEERLSRVKKDSGIPYLCLNEIVKICPIVDVLIISGYDQHFYQDRGIVSLMKKLGFKFKPKFKIHNYNKSHHFAHAAKAFYNSGFDDALVLVADGKGASYNLTNGDQANETTSAFLVSYPTKFQLIYKRLHTFSKITEDLKVVWDNSVAISKELLPRWYDSNATIELRNDFDRGFMYEGVSRAIGFDDDGGKMLGLSAYGKFDETLPTIMDDQFVFNMGLFEFNHLNQYQAFDINRYQQLFDDVKSKTNIAYVTQKQFEFSGLHLINDLLKKSGAKNLVITGGTGLNVVANYYYKKHLSPDINLFVEPMCGDEGNCIGLVQYYLRDRYYHDDITPMPNIYICGNQPSYDNIMLNENETVLNDVTDEDVVQLLIRGHIVALFQGRAEAGPRALGNRSILFDPRVKNGKEIVNNIKRRESFRPFAASILLEHAHTWFDMAGLDQSPYMMYAVDALDGVVDKVPAVIHADGTCRVQTVTAEHNLLYYNLINAFYAETSVPLLFNTSFNLAGEPIVETIEDAIASLRQSKIEYLYLPEVKKLIYIRDHLPHP
jgi:carbamoyltransferase